MATHELFSIPGRPDWETSAVRCEKCNKPKTADLSWARGRSGFSLYFEAKVVPFVKTIFYCF